MLSCYQYGSAGFVSSVPSMTGARAIPGAAEQPREVLCLVEPVPGEVAELMRMTGIREEVIADALDQGERPRMEADETSFYVVFRAPWVEGNEERADFTTPITVIFSTTHTVIVSRNACGSVQSFFDGHTWRRGVHSRAGLMVSLFHHTAERYLLALRTINADIRRKEQELVSRLRDDDLVQLLRMQNCLTYFQAALRGNELLVERMLRTRLSQEGSVAPTMHPDDLDMLDDALIDIKQGLYTAGIYAQIMDNFMRTHASIVGTRVNVAMKVLTSLTLVLMIPTLVTSAYGMNVPLPFQGQPAAFVFVGVISLGASAISVYWLWKKGWFSSGQ